MRILQDIRFALRSFRQRPVFALVAVTSLALGIGANTAIFSLIDAILLRWLPVKNPQELVMLARNPADASHSFSYPDYRYIRDNNKSFTGVVAFSGGGRPIGFALPGRVSGQLVNMSMVSGNYFNVLGVAPETGRLFNDADNVNEGAHQVAVVSYGFWQRVLGGATDVIGKDVHLNGRPFQIVGVSGEGFTGTVVGSSPDIFVPIVMYRTFSPTALRWNTRNMWWLLSLGRLRPGVTPERASAELNVLWHQILKADPRHKRPGAWDKDYERNNTAYVIAGATGYSGMRRQASKPLTILMITVALVLAIACANVANLLLARAIARRKELAIRASIGAGRGRLISQLLTESLTLSVLGGLGGLIIAFVGVKFLVSLLPSGTFPLELNISPDLRVLSFAFGVSLLSGLVFGLAPALRASRPDVVPALKSDAGASGTGGRARWSLQRTLVSLQVALSLILLAGAGLFIRTLSNLRNVDSGMKTESLLFVNTNLGSFGYQPQREKEFMDRLGAEVQRLPGVRAVAYAAITPLSGSRWNSGVTIEGYTWAPDERPIVDMNGVTPRFFESAGMQILLGRDFQDSDGLTTLPPRSTSAAPPAPDTDGLGDGPPRVVVVNKSFVDKFFGGRSPLGKRVVFSDKWNSQQTAEIVGVVSNARYFDMRKAVEPMIYRPFYRAPAPGPGELCVRASGDPRKLVESIRARITKIDSNVAITDTKTMQDNMNRVLVQERFVATVGGFFGAVALLLAAVGLYGVMSQSVSRRTREIGIRMALGAEGKRVLRLVLNESLIMVAIGAVAGLIGALALSRLTESMLYGVKPEDPLALVLAVCLLLGVTALAGYIPARRATRIEPMQALRSE